MAHEETTAMHRQLAGYGRGWLSAAGCCAALAGCAAPLANYQILDGTGVPNVRDYWAETTALSLPPRQGRPQSLIFAGAMQYDDRSVCGTTGEQAQFLGCGWATYLSGGGGVHVKVHSASDFPHLPADCPLPHGDPKAATDGKNIFYAQMCGPDFNGGGIEGDGLVVAISSDEGNSFATLCTVCVGEKCGAPLAHYVVDAPDLYYDPFQKTLYLAWWDVGTNGDGGRVIFSRNLTPTNCAGWEPPKRILVPSGISQRGPAITTWATPSGVRLLIAYHTKPVNEQVEIHVAYADDNGATPWVDQLLETVGVTDHVANGKILQLPRPDLVRRADLSTQQVVVAYPAFDAATGTNDVVTQLSSDGGVKWTKKSLPLPAATRHDRFFPTLATTEPLGRNVLLAYYDTREDPAPVGSRLGVWASVLDPSSNQWTQPFPVASGPNVPFTPCIIRGDFYGHYFAVAGASDNAPGLPASSFWPHWADSRNFQRTEVWSARIVP